MKESLNPLKLLQYQILDAYELNHIPYLPYANRRGTAPTNKGTIIPDLQNQCLMINEEREVRNAFPFTALGSLQSISKSGRRAAIGAIIHPRLVISSASALFNLEQEPSEVWFTPFSKNQQTEKHLIQKIHPSSLRKQLRKGGNIINSQGLTNQCAILQLQKGVDLESKYGSFGFRFSDTINSDPLLIGITQHEGQYQLYEQHIKVTVVNKGLSYSLTQNHRYLPGSLIVSDLKGEYEIIGIHLSCNDGKGEGMQLTKEFWKDLQRMTFKGAQINLDHQNIGRTGILLLRDLNLKKITHLELYNVGLSSAQIKTLSKLNYRLSGLSLGFNRIEDDGIAHFADSKWSLQSLYLMKTSLTYESVKVISKMNWRNMAQIDLSQNRIGSRGALYLVQSDWKNLQTLSLKKAEIDDAACDKLRKGQWPHLANIELGTTLFDKDHNKVTIQGMRWIANADWRSLETISLASNILGYEGVKQLLRAEWSQPKNIRAQKNDSGRRVGTLKAFIHQKFKKVYLFL